MRKIEFKLDKQVDKKNRLFLEVEYMDGDADRDFTEYIDLEIKFLNWTNYKEKLNGILDKWELINKKLNKDKNWRPPEEGEKGYDEILQTLMDAIPGDSTCDSCRHSKITDWELVGYDLEGRKYIAKIK